MTLNLQWWSDASLSLCCITVAPCTHTRTHARTQSRADIIRQVSWWWTCGSGNELIDHRCKQENKEREQLSQNLSSVTTQRWNFPSDFELLLGVLAQAAWQKRSHRGTLWGWRHCRHWKRSDELQTLCNMIHPSKSFGLHGNEDEPLTPRPSSFSVYLFCFFSFFFVVCFFIWKPIVFLMMSQLLRSPR